MKTYKKVLKALQNFEDNPGYNRSQDDKGGGCKTLSSLKECFQLMTNSGKIILNHDKKYNVKDLFVDGFDEEQIWRQLELRNRYLNSYVPTLTDLLLHKSEIHFPSLIKEKDVPHEPPPDVGENDAEENTSSEEEMDEDHLSDAPSSIYVLEAEETIKENMMKVPEETINETILKKNKSKRASKQGSVVDDEFFKINEMEKFLVEAEQGNMVDDIDYFDDFPSDSDSSEKKAKYDDFFRGPGSDDDQEEDIGQTFENEESDFEIPAKKSGSHRKVKFSLTDDVEESDTEDKTNFQKRESKLRQKIEKLEESNLSEKPWQYKGEVATAERPVNSLLEQVLDVDLTVRPPPVITENVTLTLEQIIRNRIKDSAYDDVERKIKPIKMPHELKKDLVLNQEKSKYSLAEVYEQEFLKQKPSTELAEENNKPDPEKENIKKAMESVFHKLNVLSNFHYTPKPVSADVEIISNMPAITMEEVTPVAMSDANLLAPQEVGDAAKKKLLGKDERTKTDKLRERRKKKKFLSHKFKKTRNTESAKISQVLKSRSVNPMKPTQDSSLNSTKFFAKLQENSEVTKTVGSKKKKQK